MPCLILCYNMKDMSDPWPYRWPWHRQLTFRIPWLSDNIMKHATQQSTPPSDVNEANTSPGNSPITSSKVTPTRFTAVTIDTSKQSTLEDELRSLSTTPRYSHEDLGMSTLFYMMTRKEQCHRSISCVGIVTFDYPLDRHKWSLSKVGMWREVRWK